MKYNCKLFGTIKELGKDLSSINLLIPGGGGFLAHIIEGCPKLKTLTIESLRGWSFSLGFIDLISKKSLKALYKSCKELKDLKLTQVCFKGISDEYEIEEIFPDCKVEIKECAFDESDDVSLLTDDSYDSDSDGWFHGGWFDEDDSECTTDDTSDSDDV